MARFPIPDARLLADNIEAGVVPALSIRQPWPHRIFHEGKDVENRDWRHRFRGFFLVHAGVSTEECSPQEIHLPRGGIVGIAQIVDCVTAMDSKWFVGRYGFVLENARPLPLTPCRGKLGFFYLDPDVNAAVARTLREAG